MSVHMRISAYDFVIFVSPTVPLAEKTLRHEIHSILLPEYTTSTAVGSDVQVLW
jgi:hypothetical protein